MKKILALILALLMLVTLLSCGAKEEETSDDSKVVDTMKDQEGLDQSEVLEVDYTTLDYGNMEISILARQHLKGEPEGVSSEGKESVVDEETQKRNKWVEDNLGIKFAYHYVPGTPSDITEYKNTISKSFMADTSEYDYTYAYAKFLPSFAAEGYAANLFEVENISPEKKWWNQSYASVNTLNGKLYSLVGDMTHTTIDETMVVFFNHEIVKNHGINPDSLYELALNGDWTMDVFETYVQTIGSQDNYASFLVGYNSSSVDGLIAGTGITVCQKTADGRFEMNIKNEYNYTMVERLKNLVHNEGIGVYRTGSSQGVANGNWKYDYEDDFATGKGAFFTFRMYYARDYLAKSSLDYGILPIPKGSADQDNYQCTPHDEYSCIAVFNNVPFERRAAIGAVIEVTDWYSHENIRPVIYETLYGTRYQSNPKSAEMLDVIVDTTSFDFGIAWTDSLGDPVIALRDYIWQNKTGLSSTLESMTSDRLLAELMFKFYGN